MVRIKKLPIIILCAVFLSGMTVNAGENTEFHVETQSGKAGDTVTVPVQFNTGEEVGGFQISVYYDSEVMEFESLEKGGLIIEEGQGIFDYNHKPESSEITVVYVVADTVKDEGVIVSLQFRLKQDCGEQLPIGMGIDLLIDNTEANNPITGEVSGVDEAFQAQVMEQTGGSAVVAEGNGTDSTVDAGTVEAETDGSNNSPGLRESETDQNEISEEKESGKRTEMLFTAVIAAAAIAAAGVSVCVVRKKKMTRINKAKELE